MKRFLVYVENQYGDFLKAFVFYGKMQDAVAKGYAQAYLKGEARPNVWVSPVANQ